MDPLQELVLKSDLWEDEESDEDLLKQLEAFGDEKLLNFRDAGQNTLVHIATISNHPTVVEFLIRKGADLNIMNLIGQSPLDIAMHWCFYEIAETLQHYGGKHSYERERDLAISQRDIARGKIKEAVAKMEEAVSDGIKYRTQFEDMKLQRDRAYESHSELISEKNKSNQRAEKAELKFENLTKAHDKLQIECFRRSEEVKAVENSKKNIVVAWEFAQKHAQDMEALRKQAEAREEAALEQKDEALAERNAARELVARAKNDKALALVCQARAENERDQALEEHRRLENKTAKKIAYWTEMVLNVEEERRNIQREISFQTEKLTRSNEKLRGDLQVERAERIDAQSRLTQLESSSISDKQLREESQIAMVKAHRETARLQRDMKLIAAARKREREIMKQKEEDDLHEETKDVMQSIATAALLVWKKLEKLNGLHLSQPPPEVQKPLPNLSRVATAPGNPLETEGENDRPQTTVGSSIIPPKQPLLSPINIKSGKVVESKRYLKKELPGAKFRDNRSWCEQAATGTTKWSKNELNMCAVQLHDLATEVSTEIDRLQNMVKDEVDQYKHFSETQKRIIDRKEAVIQRFSQHQQNPRIVEESARFRDCMFQPPIV